MFYTFLKIKSGDSIVARRGICHILQFPCKTPTFTMHLNVSNRFTRHGYFEDTGCFRAFTASET